MTPNKSNSHSDNIRADSSGASTVYAPNDVADHIASGASAAATYNASASPVDATQSDTDALEALMQNLRKAFALRSPSLDDVPPELHPVSQREREDGMNALWDYVQTALPIAMADIPLSLLNVYSYSNPPTLYLGYPISSQFIIDISRGQHDAEVERRVYPQPDEIGAVGSMTPRGAATRLTEICDISIEVAQVTNGGEHLYVVALGSNKSFRRVFNRGWIHVNGVAKLREVLGLPKGEMPKWYIDASKYRWGPGI